MPLVCSKPWTHRTARCAFQVCRRGFRGHRAGSPGRRRSWAQTLPTCWEESARPPWKQNPPLGGDRRACRVEFDMGEKATQLRGELRDLVKSHVPADFLGAFTDDPADL